MIVTNIDTVPNKAITTHYGLVMGSITQTKHVGRDFMAALKSIFGGELVGYTELLADARKQAETRMIKQAESMGANAVVNVRFSTAQIMTGCAEILCYGTAVTVA